MFAIKTIVASLAVAGVGAFATSSAKADAYARFAPAFVAPAPVYVVPAPVAIPACPVPVVVAQPPLVVYGPPLIYHEPVRIFRPFEHDRHDGPRHDFRW